MNKIEQLANTATNILWGLKAPRQLSPTQKSRAKIIAHRGVHENAMAKENTLRAFELAEQNQIWGIEFDIRWTKDFIPVVHHDPNTERIFALPCVIGNTTAHDLRQLIPEIPTLSEVVERFGKKLHLLIEIKEVLTPPKLASLQTTLAPLMPNDDYHLLTLNPKILEAVNFAPKNAFMDVDWMDMGATIQKTINFGHGAVSGHFMLLNKERLALCKKHGLITGTGFIETKGALYREIFREIDWIFTNHPLRLKAYLS